MSLLLRNLRRINVRTLVLVAALILLGSGQLIFGPPANAHAQLVSSTPGDGKTVTSAPSEIVLQFSGALIEGSDTIIAETANGSDKSRLATTVNNKTIIAEWPTGWGAGKFEISYRVASSDGHIMTGGINFRINPASAGSASEAPSEAEDEPTNTGSTAAASATDTNDRGAVPAWLWVSGGIVLVGVLAWWLAVGRRSMSDD